MADRVAPDVRDMDADGLVARALAVLPDLRAARRIADLLVRRKEERAVFGLCLLTLEMALLKDPRARMELPVRVPVLLDAYRDPALAARLVGEVPELKARWERVQPLVKQFLFERLATEASPVAALPPPPPRSTSPGESRVSPAIEEVLEEPAVPPPAPPPALAPGAPPPPPVDGELEEGSGPAGDPAARRDLDVAAFWRFTTKALGRVPAKNGRMAGGRAFCVDRGADREKLDRFAEELVGRFAECPPALALASLTQLFVASQQKERRLLSGVNRARLERMRKGLALLGSWSDAPEVAALFEADGEETRAAFAAVVDLVGEYLAFCHAERLDPLADQAPGRFASR